MDVSGFKLASVIKCISDWLLSQGGRDGRGERGAGGTAGTKTARRFYCFIICGIRFILLWYLKSKILGVV